ncbi:hypothetical protein POX_g09029 [Penicillium oxalicum]|uniref:hypothetical protein n=1 Tax=Penicillium oxalicum TaxID=69781 RepID=UPI0020B6FC5B|nr:hypothetical protein POX_g09029 [Penicillium oxalicum]KAI2786641.1 hypothetical protein POX_g09029 [Penicillium oxalicum]
MTVQPVDASCEAKSPRGDRLQEEPSAKNAQGLFPPAACIFVGNLSTKVSPDILANDLKSVFTEFGSCHVKIKQDRKKGLPGAFVQFERVEDANAALAREEPAILHDRPLRIEKAKAQRVACLGLRSLQPITTQDVVAALGSRGPLETYTIESQQTGLQSWTDVAKVTFAFVDDYRDAIRHFHKDERYYLHPFEMDHNLEQQGTAPGPAQDPVNHLPPRPKATSGLHFSRSGNFQHRHGGPRQYRNGNGNYRGRGGHRRGYPQGTYAEINEDISRFAPPPPPPHQHPMYNGYPAFMGPPPSPDMYGNYSPQPYMPAAHPGFMGHHTPPDMYGHYSPPPFMSPGHPVPWIGPPHGYFPGPAYPENGSIYPHPGYDGYQDEQYGYPPNPGYGEPWAGPVNMPPSPPDMEYPTADQAEAEPESQPQVIVRLPGPTEDTTAPAATESTGSTETATATEVPAAQPVITTDNEHPTEEEGENTNNEDNGDDDYVAGVPLNPKVPEKAPRLIRVHNDDKEEDEATLITRLQRISCVNQASMSPIMENTDDESITAVESRSRSRSCSLSIRHPRSHSHSSSISISHPYSASRSRSTSTCGFRSTSPFKSSMSVYAHDDDEEGDFVGGNLPMA